MNTGSGWILANTGNYEGFGLNELTIKELDSDLDGAQFRCVITGCIRDDGHEYGDTTDIISVQLGAMPTITTQPQSAQYCPGFEKPVRLEIEVGSGDSLDYQWYRNGSPVSGATHDSLYIGIPDETNSGDYYIEISSSCGTATSETATVGVYDSVNASASMSFSGDSIFADSTLVTLEAAGGASYEWNTGELGSQLTVSPSTTGTHSYYVSVSSSVGCQDTASVSFIAYQKPLPPPPVEDTTLSTLEEYPFPNVFSPNNDGRNDYFIIKADNTSPLLFRVFNRYGAVIYETESRFVTWDGHAASGELVSPGTYYYSVETEGFQKIGMIAVFH
jgi:gliding motility-associated-like protein